MCFFVHYVAKRWAARKQKVKQPRFQGLEEISEWWCCFDAMVKTCPSVKYLNNEVAVWLPPGCVNDLESGAKYEFDALPSAEHQDEDQSQGSTRGIGYQRHLGSICQDTRGIRIWPFEQSVSQRLRLEHESKFRMPACVERYAQIVVTRSDQTSDLIVAFAGTVTYESRGCARLTRRVEQLSD